jgi:hypothetical protein
LLGVLHTHRPLDHDRFRHGSFANAVERRMPKHAVPRPVREFDGDHQARLDPGSAPGELPRDRDEGRSLTPELLKATQQVALHAHAEADSDPASEVQFAILVEADQKGFEVAAGRLRDCTTAYNQTPAAGCT